MGKIILFGEPMALLIADTPGPLEEAEHFTRALSGAEVNVAIGLSRLGHQASYLTRLGDDPFGHYISNTLRQNGIGTEFVTYDDVYRTGIQLKNRVEDGSDPYAPYYRKGSAASHITSAEIEQIDFNGVDHVHVTGIPAALSRTSREASYRLMERARENGAYLTFDPNLRPCLWESRQVMAGVVNDMASRADMVLPGIEECKVLCGSQDYESIADFYQKNGTRTVIVKDGAKGAFVRDGHDTYHVAGYKVEKIVDTVGAGDGFAVGVISGHLEGLPVKEMVRRGNAIGAIQVMNLSDNAGLPTKAQLDAFMNR